MASRSASEFARETLKQIAAHKLQPTPDNYQAIYDKISGQATQPPFPAMRMRQIVRVIPGQTPTQRRLLDQLTQAVEAQDWSALQHVMVGYATLGRPAAPAADKPAAEDTLPTAVAEPLARLVEAIVPALGEDDARIRELAAQLEPWLRQSAPETAAAARLLADFSHRTSFAGEQQSAIRAGLLMLLHLVFDNIAVLCPDDTWLHGQAQALRDAATPPLSLHRIDDVQQRLRGVIARQAETRERAVQAQQQMRELLATFIDRLAQMDESSAAYHEQLTGCAERISQVDSLQELGPLLQEVMTATRTMTQSSRAMRTELHDLRQRAEATNAENEFLRQELERTSAQARHDPLTGSLNRKGLEEALERETARSLRGDSPLCIALLDLDNFKALNDRLGHAAGDAALVHLVETTRSIMRPQDQLARFGGEEFVLLLPDTTLEQGVEAMRRLQRELTRHYFLQGDERALITFSAGVAQFSDSESSADALKRADQAMYLAKRSGKNRVVAA